MTDLLIFLAVWLIPWFVCCIMIYLDMEKGQSIEEYFNDDEPFKIFIFCPLVNIFLAVFLCVWYIWERFNNFRK